MGNCLELLSHSTYCLLGLMWVYEKVVMMAVVLVVMLGVGLLLDLQWANEWER